MFRKIENKKEWDDLLGKVIFKTFFHTLEWENFLEKEFPWMKFERYVWRDELFLSIARCRLFGREKLVSHPFCEYGGPLPLKEKIDLESFVNDFKKEFGPKVRMKFHPYILGSSKSRGYLLAHSRSPSGDLRGSGCFAPDCCRGTMPKQPSNPPEDSPSTSLRSISTFWIEDFSKKSQEDLWSGFRKTLKQEIKKGEGFVEIEECANESELKQFYNLYLRTVRGHKNIPLPFSVFSMFNGHTNRYTKIFLAKHKGKVVGGSVFLFYAPFIHYFISASDDKFRNTSIGHQILWHIMKKYVGSPTPNIGYDYFDLGGTRKGSALEVFKRGWGAGEHSIYEIGGKGAGSGKSYLRNLIAFIPPVLMKRLSHPALWAKI